MISILMGKFDHHWTGIWHVTRSLKNFIAVEIVIVTPFTTVTFIPIIDPSNHLTSDIWIQNSFINTPYSYYSIHMGSHNSFIEVTRWNGMASWESLLNEQIKLLNKWTRNFGKVWLREIAIWNIFGWNFRWKCYWKYYFDLTFDWVIFHCLPA